MESNEFKRLEQEKAFDRFAYVFLRLAEKYADRLNIQSIPLGILENREEDKQSA